MVLTHRILGAATAGIAALFGAAASAQDSAQALADLEIVGRPIDGGIGFQPAATELAVELQSLDGALLILITAITLFVTALLAWCVVRYNSKVNKVPARFTHHTTIEIVWTLAPVIILVVLAAISLPILFKQQEIPEADVTIKATGYQWYWGYEYPEHDLAYEAFMLERDELEEYGYTQDEYLLATSMPVVVPVNKVVVVQVTAADVIHSWTIPAFGVKQDGVPGRLAELWFEAKREGVYFGQCSELCGKNHAFMPITVKVVSQEVYDAWIADTVKEFAGTPDVLTVASN